MIALLRDVRSLTPPPYAAEIEQLLDTTVSFRLRNAAALALADLDATEACARIGELLGRPEVAPQSGTLLFALDELRGSLPLASFLNIVRNGSFEGRSEALHFLDEDRVSATDPEMLGRAVDHLASIAAGADAEAAEAAREALSILSTRTDRPMPAELHR